jgi:integrase
MAAKIMTPLRMLLGAAIERGEIFINPAAGIRVKQQSRHTEGVAIPTKIELRVIMRRLTSADPPGFAEAVIATALLAGLRASELRGLPRALIKLGASPQIVVTQRADRWNMIGAVKTKAGRRTVPIGPLLAGILRRWFKARDGGELGLAFPNGAGNVENLANIYNRNWKPFCTALGLVGTKGKTAGKPLYNFHALRHACTSLWIEQGIPANKMQSWMGHSSIKVTQDLYGHLFSSEADDAAIAAAVERELLK